MRDVDHQHWYIFHGGDVRGPYEIDIVRWMVQIGEVDAGDRIRAKGTREWIRARDSGDLDEAFSQRARAARPSTGAMGPSVPPPMESLAPTPLVGDVLADKYRIVEELGGGGMGMIFGAEHLLTHKQVAIKWLQPEVADEPEITKRLLQEARIAAKISHPNVIDIYDVGEQGRSLFLVMEYLRGQTLTEALAQRRLKPDDILRTLIAAMRGVAAAHRQGVIHRDLKPDNIILRQDASGVWLEPKVVDFGISKLTTRQGDLSLTMPGTVLGTPLYASPEQLGASKLVDHRTDVYSLGVILYEAMTGALPFREDNLSALIFRIAQGDPVPPHVRDPAISEALSGVIMKAIARKPADRFPSVEAFATALAPLAGPGAMKTQTTTGRMSAHTGTTHTPFGAETLRRVPAPRGVMMLVSGAMGVLVLAGLSSTALKSITHGGGQSQAGTHLVEPVSPKQVAVPERGAGNLAATQGSASPSPMDNAIPSGVARPAEVKARSAALPAAPSAREVARFVARVHPAGLACGGGVQGRVIVGVTVLGRGNVRDVRVEGASPSVARCIDAAYRKGSIAVFAAPSFEIADALQFGAVGTGGMPPNTQVAPSSAPIKAKAALITNPYQRR